MSEDNAVKNEVRIEAKGQTRQPDKQNKQTKQTEAKIAVIRIRGTVGVKGEIADTMSMLNLHKKHFCSVIDSNPSTLGMIKKCKDYVTFGEIDAAIYKLLRDKKGKEGKKFFRLCPPKGGFGRKGIKVPFNSGGTLGYRGDKINDLIKRMI